MKIGNQDTTSFKVGAQDVVRGYIGSTLLFNAATGATDADAANYISRVETEDGQALEAGVVTAIDDLFIGLKADGNFAALSATVLLCAARTLPGALEPLESTMPSATSVNFVSGDYNRKTGLIGDSTSKYINSGLANDADPRNDSHTAVYLSSALSSATELYSGAGAFEDGANAVGQITTSQFYRNRVKTGYEVTGVLTGFQGHTRGNSNNFQVLRGSNSEVNQFYTSQAPVTENVFVFARNVDGSPSLYSGARMSFASVGAALDLPQVRSRIETFLTAIDGAIA